MSKSRFYHHCRGSVSDASLVHRVMDRETGEVAVNDVGSAARGAAIAGAMNLDPKAGEWMSPETAARAAVLVNHEVSGLEEGNGLDTDVWHLIFGLRRLCRAEGIDFDALAADVKTEEPVICGA